MQELVRAAMRDGAIGFTSSQLELHVAHDGRGVPSNHAAPEELVALAGVLARVRPRLDRVHPAHVPRRLRRRRPRADARRWRGRRVGPVHLNTLTRDAARARRLVAQPRVRRDAPRPTGSRSTRCSRRNRQGAHFSLGSTFLFDEMPTLPRHAHAAVAGTRSACATPRCASRCGSTPAPLGQSKPRAPVFNSLLFVWSCVPLWRSSE